MTTAQIRCRGCDRVFSPRGLSQHLSKTQDAVCREAQSTSRTPSLFQVVSGAGSASALNPNTNEANLNELHAANVTAAADDANGDHTTDAADASDANLLEELANGTFLSTNPEQVPPVTDAS